ncbi:hypothetical protein YQE_12435, partial [Dendroctonus ponderosae]
MYHLVKVITKIPRLEGWTCGRTKTTAIVKNVLGQHSFEDSCSELRKSKFSLIVDESTDLSTRFPSDGANVMMRARKSLMTLLTKNVPLSFVLKCICVLLMRRYVEDVTCDIYNYFESSPKRVLEFAKFQNLCKIKIHKILRPFQTRWLSVHAAVARILEQYNDLKSFFVDAVDRNDILAAENVLSRLNDSTTKFFLQFLDYILTFFNNLNREMQSESPNSNSLRA